MAGAGEVVAELDRGQAGLDEAEAGDRAEARDLAEGDVGQEFLAVALGEQVFAAADDAGQADLATGVAGMGMY